MGSLGSRGVTFTAELPGQLSELISAVGDLDGDGKKDYLFVRQEAALEWEPTVYLVYCVVSAGHQRGVQNRWASTR